MLMVMKMAKNLHDISFFEITRNVSPLMNPCPSASKSLQSKVQVGLPKRPHKSFWIDSKSSKSWPHPYKTNRQKKRRRKTFKNHLRIGHHQQKVFHQPKLVRFTFSICLLSSCSLLSLISPLHLVRQVMDSKFPCWICRRSWDCKASGRECATLSALHCCTVFQCAHVYTTLMCFTLIWSAFQYLCFHRLVLHLTFPSVNWTNYPPPTSQAHSWWDLKYYDVRLVRPKIDTWISPSWVC